ncbi:MAG: antibiotic biosynthesis monooxygenase [Flavobacteriaceae bacterium]|nr:antibiotic biosynthesis monooxygenase [Flavobacteriaceae bacterium]
MLIRIVKMKFKEEEIENFLDLFHHNKNHIRNFEGCEHLELYQDKNNPQLFFTYSFWQSEDALNGYRNSDLFAEVWKNTKIKFSAKPEAWSVNRLVNL